MLAGCCRMRRHPLPTCCGKSLQQAAGDGRFSLLHAPGQGYLLQRLAGHLGMGRRPGNDDAHALIHLAQIEGAGRGCIGITVALHGLFGQGSFQGVKDLSTPAPVRNAGAFEMGDDHRHTAVAAGRKASLMAARISSASVRMCVA